jgi:hypothetical protein
VAAGEAQTWQNEEVLLSFAFQTRIFWPIESECWILLGLGVEREKKPSHFSRRSPLSKVELGT